MISFTPVLAESAPYDRRRRARAPAGDMILVRGRATLLRHGGLLPTGRVLESSPRPRVGGYASLARDAHSQRVRRVRRFPPLDTTRAPVVRSAANRVRSCRPLSLLTTRSLPAVAHSLPAVTRSPYSLEASPCGRATLG
jgi:hypothetical protein